MFTLKFPTAVQFIIPPPIEERSIVMTVSVCLAVSGHISGTACLIFPKLFTHVSYIRGLVLFWRRCDMLCTYSFMDGVFVHNGQE